MPGEVPVTRVTVTGETFAGSDDGSAWLTEILADRQRSADEVRAATRLLSIARSPPCGRRREDPLVQEIGASRALAIRLGHGSGDELAEGRWTEAREMPRPRRGRLDDVEPQSRVAAVLAGRDEVHPAETLILRARLDAQQGRSAEALYGLRAATAALEERPSERSKQIRQQLEALRERLES